jgi:serine/threonine protein kinase
MSTVYVARDTHFRQVERLCAVKVMVSHAMDEATRTIQRNAFEREAAMLATLRHPGIPQVFDFFTLGETSYLVLEYIEGEDLERVLSRSREPIPEARLVDWALQILDVLAYLHSRDPEPIVFRDMKPSNVMLRPTGSLCLIDFGIARVFQPLQRGTMIGTEGYAPPEQYRGIAEPRGDLYALGATLYHLATRIDPRTEPPFSLSQRPPRMSNPKLSEGFEAVILRALAYNPSDRYPSATAMAEALRALQDSRPLQPVSAERSSSLSKLSRSVDEPATEVGVIPSSLSDHDRSVWTARTGDEVRGTATIARDLVLVGSYDGYLYALELHNGRLVWRFPTGRGVVSRPAVSQNSVVFGSEDGAVYAVDRKSSALRWRYLTALPVRSSPFVADGLVVIGSDDGFCYTLDSDSGQLVWRRPARGPIRSSPVVEASAVVVGSDDAHVYCWRFPDGQARWRRGLGGPVLSSPATADASVVIGCLDGRVYRLRLDNGEIEWSLITGGPVVATPLVTGGLVIIGSADGILYAVDCERGSVVWSRRLGDQITGGVAAVGSLGVVGTVDGRLVCFDLDGECRWSVSLGAPIVATPVISGGLVIVGALDGRVYALRLEP